MRKRAEIFNESEPGLGAGANVRLSERERGWLVEKYGEEATAAKIEDLSHYLNKKRTRYKSHFWVLRDWMRRDKTIALATPPKLLAPLLEEAELRERAEILHSIRAHEARVWEAGFRFHTHGLWCQFGKCCQFIGVKRPSVPTLEELVKQLREADL